MVDFCVLHKNYLARPWPPHLAVGRFQLSGRVRGPQNQAMFEGEALCEVAVLMPTRGLRMGIGAVHDVGMEFSAAPYSVLVEAQLLYFEGLVAKPLGHLKEGVGYFPTAPSDWPVSA